jgi:hypothetical protein
MSEPKAVIPGARQPSEDAFAGVHVSFGWVLHKLGEEAHGDR